jgi:hypothetical protein
LPVLLRRPDMQPARFRAAIALVQVSLPHLVGAASPA